MVKKATFPFNPQLTNCNSLCCVPCSRKGLLESAGVQRGTEYLTVQGYIGVRAWVGAVQDAYQHEMPVATASMGHAVEAASGLIILGQLSLQQLQRLLQELKPVSSRLYNVLSRLMSTRM